MCRVGLAVEAVRLVPGGRWGGVPLHNLHGGKVNGPQQHHGDGAASAVAVYSLHLRLQSLPSMSLAWATTSPITPINHCHH